MGQRQINIRVGDDEIAVLEAAAFIEGRGLADEVRAAVKAHAAALEEEADIAAALKLRAERSGKRAAPEGAVSSLDAKRKRSEERGT